LFVVVVVVVVVVVHMWSGGEELAVLGGWIGCHGGGSRWH
jgi:hypothetical protein